MADWDSYILSRLFIVVPELSVDAELLEALFLDKVIPREFYELGKKYEPELKRAMKLEKKMRSKTLLERLYLLSPELISVRTVDFLRRYNLLSVQEAHSLRILTRAVGAFLPVVSGKKSLIDRSGYLFDAVFGSDLIGIVREMDDERINQLRSALLRTSGNQRLNKQEAAVVREMLEDSIYRAQAARSALSLGRFTFERYAEARKLSNIWDIATVGIEGLLSDDVLKNAIRMGLISRDRYDTIRSIEQLGLTVWKRTTKAFDYDSWQARSLLISEGILSPEMISALGQLGILSVEQRALLYPAALAIRTVTRSVLTNTYMNSAKMRVTAGETPIDTFRRVSSQTDRQILQLLAEAAKDAGKDAEKLMASEKFGSMTRARQQRLIQNELHGSMRRTLENVGHMIIFGEKEAAHAAAEAMEGLTDLWPGKLQDAKRMHREYARAGMDAFVSRQENLKPLSRQIYKTLEIVNGQVSREINKALLRGLDAAELANRVEDLIRPNVRGGVSYSAMRLARTEINNAFHFTAIRYTREMPWVDGYDWHLSGSHPKRDICDEYARREWTKRDVPGKPHPQCFCYLTPRSVDDRTFERNLRNGTYNSYMRNVARDGFYTDKWAQDVQEFGLNDFQRLGLELGEGSARMVGTAAGGALISAVQRYVLGS